MKPHHPVTLGDGLAEGKVVKAAPTEAAIRLTAPFRLCRRVQAPR